MSTVAVPHHAVLGIGELPLCDRFLRCYYAPSLDVSAISVADILTYALSVFFHNDGRVDAQLPSSTLSMMLCAPQKPGRVFSSHSALINYVRLQRKKDDFGLIHVHWALGHPHLKATAAFCKQTGFKMLESDRSQIRDCSICVQTHLRSASHCRTSTLSAIAPLQRMHLDSLYISKNEHYFALMTDEHSHYIFTLHDKSKARIREMLIELVSHISGASPLYKIAFINGDQGTELPSATILWEEFNIDATPHTTHTPSLNGKAENSNQIVMQIARSFITDMLTDINNVFFFRKLRTVHAMYVHNRSTNSAGRCPYTLLHDASVPLASGAPYFWL